MEQQKGKFDSNFGFLMASLGSAVGLGNLWGFPFKMGLGGGFAFLLLYVILLVVVGYPLVLSEVAIGRKSQKAAIEAYKEIHPGFTFNGVLQTAVPFFLIAFYCTFGGYVMKYFFKSLTMFGGKQFEPGPTFGETLMNASSVVWVLIFLALTIVIVLGGVSGGIEKFCKIAMPALFIMLVVIAIRSCTLSGAGAGLAFLFKPHFEGMNSVGGFFETLKLAGSQMFFSLSLASGCLIAYGSYLDKKENLEKDAVIITVGDTCAALLAGLAIMPACAAYGLEFGAGPGLLFVSMPTVFNDMKGGAFFALLFWLLVFFACLSSSIGMMEGGISAILDSRIKKGKSANRFAVTMIMGAWAVIGNLMTALDGPALADASNPSPMGWFHLFGIPDVLDVWDAVAEGILMPLTGLIMAILIGWVVPHYIDDEVESSSAFKSKGFFNFCIKWLGPIFMALIVWGQISSVIGMTK
ncbi:MAG: sodium-dependent transporter [Clostridiales bacterium]|nr:sodium-dependent transporter [Clostridiales bacterium]